MVYTTRKYAKLSIGADVLQQIISTIKIRRAPTRHDNIDFKPIITKTSEILPLSVVTADKAYDSEENHVLVRELLHGYSIIPTRYENVPIWKTHGRYRKQMKRGYSKLLYGQRNKNETIVSMIKRLIGEHITSRLLIPLPVLTIRAIAEPLPSTCILFLLIRNVLYSAKRNMQYDRGIEAGRLMALHFNSTDDLKCPSKNKDFKIAP